MYTFLISITLKDGYEIPCRDDKEHVVSFKMQQPNWVSALRCVKSMINMDNVESWDMICVD